MMAMTIDAQLQWRVSAVLNMQRDFWQLNILRMRQTRYAPLKELFDHRAGPIRQAISTLEQIIDRLDGVVGPEENAVSMGMVRAHQQFLALTPPQELIDLQNALDALVIARLTIAEYSAAVAMLRMLRLSELAQMLEQHIQSESAFVERLEGLLPELYAETSREMRKAA